MRTVIDFLRTDFHDLVKRVEALEHDAAARLSALEHRLDFFQSTTTHAERPPATQEDNAHDHVI